MATKILIPTPLRPYTDKRDAVEAEGTTVGELLADLTKRHSGLKAHLYNEQGKLRSFVNVYLNDEDIRYLQKEQTPVSAGDTISIIPSVAGGNQNDNEFGHVVVCSSGHLALAACCRENITR
jgi:molybdopterin converting factor small subunit